MKHIDKSMGVNLHIMDTNHYSQNKKAIMERINILILIVLGCSGLYVYSNITSPKKPGVRFSTLTANATIAPSNGQKDYVKVKGTQGAGEQLQFILSNYDPNAKYRIEFGDNEMSILNKSTINHTYKNPGQYNLKLIINHDNQPVQRINQKITINESIQVVSGTK